ncbi:hypothetical protein AB0G49_14255 [Streptomyces longwoodensis]|uniref:hypothetical protein n=1 Tax=Streptomyces longwoodensis TaxID=68231 RepID=UPI0033F95908
MITTPAVRTDGNVLLAALAQQGIHPLVRSSPAGDGAEMLAHPDNHACGILHVTGRRARITYPATEHTGWMVYLRHPGSTFQDAPLYAAGATPEPVDIDTDTAAVTAFLTEYRAAPTTVDRARAVLRAAAWPRSQARDYRMMLHHKGAAVTSWGHAMACAQKSIRNGATIHPHGAGEFTLTAPDGGRAITFKPHPRTT